MSNLKSAAIVTIRDAEHMTAKGRRDIAAWLRKQADALVKDGKLYAKRFTARYLYAVCLLLLVGCTTAHDLGGGRYLVPRAIEERSLFGTNMGFAWIEACDGMADPKQPGMLYRNCEPVTEKIPMSSQGQGGQITSGLLNAAGLWGLGALMPSGSVTNNASAVASPTTVVKPSGGHK
jgi:hypothetical protein